MDQMDLGVSTVDSGCQLLDRLISNLNRRGTEAQAFRYGSCLFYLVEAFLAVAFCLCFVVQLIAVNSYRRANTFLEGLADRIISPDAPPSVQALAMFEYMRRVPLRTNNDYFLLPMFVFLRPPAMQIATDGGDCADHSRLLITLLGTHGIHGSKWALYDRNGDAKHAVVEIDTELGKMAVDPYFGLVFPRPDKEYYAVRDLKDDPRILRDRVTELMAQRERPGVVDLKYYPLNSDIYDNARTINWNKSASMKWLYRFLHAIIGVKVDYITRPAWAERPSLMVLYGAFAPESIILAAMVIANFYRRRAQQILRLSHRLYPNTFFEASNLQKA